MGDALILLLALPWIFTVLFSFLFGVFVGHSEHEEKAVKAGVARYNPKTARFEFLNKGTKYEST
jgi:hypothetical protein